MATAPTKKTPARSSTAVREHLFVWEGKDKTGKIIRGEMRATTENVVQTVLRRQGVLAHKIRKQAFARGRKIDDKDIALFTRQLATMMRSGVRAGVFLGAVAIKYFRVKRSLVRASEDFGQ